MELMEELNSTLDNEEKVLLLISCLSLLLTISFLYSYYKVFRDKMNYSEIPILVIAFGYFNYIAFYFYSEQIYHDYMNMIYKINFRFSFILILIYLKYEFKEDKIDTFLNFFIVITVSWAIKKLLKDILDDEEKIKYCSCFSTITFLAIVLEWIIRAFKEKNKNILNILFGFCLTSASIGWALYGYIYVDLSFLIPNIIGVIVSFAYISIWIYLKRKYGDVKDDKKDNVIEIDTNNKNEKNEQTKFQKVINEEEEQISDKKNK